MLEEYRKRGRIVDGGAIEPAQAAAARGWMADTLVGKRSVVVVDTNEQAADVSAHIRAELVRLGRVHRTQYPTREHARRDIARYIELHYNTRRLHSALGYKTPQEVHDEYQNRQAAA